MQYGPEALKKQALEQEKKERYDAYWLEHAEERKSLEDKLSGLKGKLEGLGMKAKLGFSKEARDIKAEINEMESELSRER